MQMSNRIVLKPDSQTLGEVSRDLFFKYLKKVTPKDDCKFSRADVDKILDDGTLEDLNGLSLRVAGTFVIGQFTEVARREAMGSERFLILGTHQAWSGKGAPYNKTFVTLARIEDIDPNNLERLPFDYGEHWEGVPDDFEGMPADYPILQEVTALTEMTMDEFKGKNYRHQNVTDFFDFSPKMEREQLLAFLEQNVQTLPELYDSDPYYKQKCGVLLKGKVFEFKPLIVQSKKWADDDSKSPPETKTVHKFPFIVDGKWAFHLVINLGTFSGEEYALNVNMYPGDFSQPVVLFDSNEAELVLVQKLKAIQHDAGIPDDAFNDPDYNHKNVSAALKAQGKLVTKFFEGRDCFIGGGMARKLILKDDQQQQEDDGEKRKWLEVNATLVVISRRREETVILDGQIDSDGEELVILEDEEEKVVAGEKTRFCASCGRKVPSSEIDSGTGECSDCTSMVTKKIVARADKDILAWFEENPGVHITIKQVREKFHKLSEETVEDALTKLLMDGTIFEPRGGIFMLSGMLMSSTRTLTKPKLIPTSVLTPVLTPVPAPALSLTTVSIPSVATPPKPEPEPEEDEDKKLGVTILAYLDPLIKAGAKGIRRKYTTLANRFIKAGATQAGFDEFILFLELSGLIRRPSEGIHCSNLEIILPSQAREWLAKIMAHEELLIKVLKEELHSSSDEMKALAVAITGEQPQTVAPETRVVAGITTPASVSTVPTSMKTKKFDVAVEEAKKMLQSVPVFVDPPDEGIKMTALTTLATSFRNNPRLKPFIEQTGDFTKAEILLIYNKTKELIKG
jgi:hypothetical protein